MNSIILEIVLGYYLADIASGIGHWFEDRYITSKIGQEFYDFTYNKFGKYIAFFVGKPVAWFLQNTLGVVAKENEDHHDKPRQMIYSTFFESILRTVQITLPIFGTMLYFGYGWNVTFFTFAFFVTIVNQIHKWSHMTSKELPYGVKFLQDWHMILTYHNHSLHHRDDFDKSFCIISDHLNPIFDKIKLWHNLEKLIEFTTGMKPVRNDGQRIKDQRETTL